MRSVNAQRFHLLFDDVRPALVAQDFYNCTVTFFLKDAVCYLV